VALVLAGISVTTVRALTGGPSQTEAGPSFSSVVCRDVDAPYAAHPLGRAAVQQLDDARSGELPASDLGTPTVRDARSVDKLRTSDGPFMVCALRRTDRVLLVRRQLSEDLNHCYGPPGACSEPRQVWVTCFEALNLSSREHGEPADCVGYPADH
jgi:hypothetical protein